MVINLSCVYIPHEMANNGWDNNTKRKIRKGDGLLFGFGEKEVFQNIYKLEANFVVERWNNTI